MSERESPTDQAHAINPFVRTRQSGWSFRSSNTVDDNPIHLVTDHELHLTSVRNRIRSDSLKEAQNQGLHFSYPSEEPMLDIGALAFTISCSVTAAPQLVASKIHPMIDS